MVFNQLLVRVDRVIHLQKQAVEFLQDAVAGQNMRNQRNFYSLIFAPASRSAIAGSTPSHWPRYETVH
jgi:hypothetical protein